jgi:hypothetical protein
MRRRDDQAPRARGVGHSVVGGDHHAEVRALAAHVIDAVWRELGLEVDCEVVSAGMLRRVEANARRVHDRRRVTASGADQHRAGVSRIGRCSSRR